MGASESTPTKVRTPLASPAMRPRISKAERISPKKEAKNKLSPKSERKQDTGKPHKNEKQVTFSDRVEKKKIGHLRQVSLPEKPGSPVLKSSLKSCKSYPTSPTDDRNFLFPEEDAGENFCDQRPNSSKRNGVYVSSMELKLGSDSSFAQSGQVLFVSDNTCVFTRNRKAIVPRPTSEHSTSLEFTAVKHIPVYVSTVDSLCNKKREKQTSEVETQTDDLLEVRQRPKRNESPLSRSRRSSGYASANGSPTVSRIELPDNVFAESINGTTELKPRSIIPTGPPKPKEEGCYKPTSFFHIDTDPADKQEIVYDKNCETDGLSKGRKASFRGFLRIQLNISRKINVLAGTTPPSLYDLLQADDATSLAGKEMTSFSLPRGAFKSVHVTSETTTGHLITLLLKKFHVVDDPRKFALYEKYAEDGDTVKAHLRRVDFDEKPLEIVLKWPAAERLGVFASDKTGLINQKPQFIRSFVLQENDSGDIMWEAFTIPELETFLRILEREETEYRNQILRKYKNVRDQMLLLDENRNNNCSILPPKKLVSSSSSESEEEDYLTMKRNKTLPLMQKYDKDRFADANDCDSDSDATLKPSSSKSIF
ncbi:uncharacterized protein LOC136027477 isoform X2 [Artemia franciscana]|uniref:uncharacterized protein LOC136027477 isoform X2 n=1 Tax=Artemia franciscana TaxID=6661 RepID=UPI0032DB2AD3